MPTCRKHKKENYTKEILSSKPKKIGQKADFIPENAPLRR
jgi:hypothetical protein